MAVSMATAEQALKTVYKGTAVEQINTGTNPLYNEIEKTSENVYGKDIKILMAYGINGGVGAGSETGNLPTANGNQYKQATWETKNLYGTIEISDKAIKASQNNVGSFVDLLNAEMEGIIKAAKFNFGRMLFGDGVGKLATCAENTDTTTLTVDSCKYLIEGLTIDIRVQDGSIKSGGGARRILAVNRAEKKILISGANITTAATDFITVQGSYNMELTGLAKIFAQTGSLYGIDKAANYWMIPMIKSTVGSISDVKIQALIDDADEVADSKINLLLAASGVKRAYQAYLETTKRTVNSLDLKGGFKALSYNGIPLTSDKFCPAGSMHGFNTGDFSLNQIDEWDWLNEDGKILKQVAGTPIWTATLVKYADLACRKPIGQIKWEGITES